MEKFLKLLKVGYSKNTEEITVRGKFKRKNNLCLKISKEHTTYEKNIQCGNRTVHSTLKLQQAKMATNKKKS